MLRLTFESSLTLILGWCTLKVDKVSLNPGAKIILTDLNIKFQFWRYPINQDRPSWTQASWNKLDFFSCIFQFFLLSVCPGLIIIFCNCVFPLLDGKKTNPPLWVYSNAPSFVIDETKLRQSYWSLTKPKSGCQQPNYSHVHKNWKFLR